jgi:2-hydroxymethylglutarate dehydrogenase
MNVGFIGIGQMGRHMSKRVLDAGYELTVHDIRREAAASLLENGAKWGDTPKDVANACSIVISSMPTPQTVEEIVYGPNGLQAGWKQGDIYIDMSTNSPTTIRRISADAASMGVSVLDAPVSGGVRGAEAGTLVIIVGGSSDPLEKAKKILETMGKNIFHVGDVGCGNVVKLVNNLICLGCNAITAEGFVLGVKAGIDPKMLWEIVRISTGGNWCLQQYPNSVFKGNFEPGFKISLAYKDVSLALALGEEYSVPFPVGTVVKQGLADAMEAGLADKGVDAVILPLERITGVAVRDPGQDKG